MDEQKRVFSEGTIRVCAKDRKKNYRVRLEMLNGKKNRNDWVYENIDRHVMEFADIPILYSVIGNKVANSHDFEVKTDPRTGKKYASFIGATSEHQAGWIVEKIDDRTNPHIENIDGVDWVVAEGIFPTFYNKEFLDELDKNGGKMSISIETLVTKSRVVDGVEYEEEYEVIGVTVLGTGVTEAVAGANIRAASADAFEDLKLRAASYYEEQKLNNKKEQNKMSKILVNDELIAKFNGYTVLGVNGQTVALLSNNGRFYSYTFIEGEDSVVPERIHENAAAVVIGEGDTAVSVEGGQVANALMAQIHSLSTANNTLANEVTTLKGEIDKMKENEIKRRKNAVKAAIQKRLAEIRRSCSDITADKCDELCKDEKLAEYAEMEKDGEWCGEEKACKDVDAVCMNDVLAIAARANARKSYVFDEPNFVEGKPSEGGVNDVLNTYDK